MPNNALHTDAPDRRAGELMRSAAERPECEGRRPLWMGNIERGKK
jgi:hypothetical protein